MESTSPTLTEKQCSYPPNRTCHSGAADFNFPPVALNFTACFNMQLLTIVLLLLVLALAAGKATPGRANRVVDEKVSGLDEATRRRILAMQQSGMPKEAIAKKIAYVAGGEGTARRMVDRINLEEKRKTYAHQQKQRSAAFKSTKASATKKR